MDLLIRNTETQLSVHKPIPSNYISCTVTKRYAVHRTSQSGRWWSYCLFGRSRFRTSARRP